MAITFVPRKKKYLKNGKIEEKYFAIPKTRNTLGIKELAIEISDCSMVNESAIVSVLIELSNIMRKRIVDGYNIKLDGIGTFGIAITSPSYDLPDEINIKEIKATKITFRSDNKLNKVLKSLKFRKMPPPPKGYVSRAKSKKTIKEEENL
ncbi:MAG: DNA-binding protein [Bacteroidetes bacterium]|nr:DNA-binding protein [Bacteroidota bacterium]